jgi:tRNA (guanine-N7-)-methyltransferase
VAIEDDHPRQAQTFPVRTFHARKGRLSAAKRQAIDQLATRFAVGPGERMDALDLGCGTGETALWLARERPDWVVLAIDVHTASIATLLRTAAAAELQNLRIERGDGLEYLRHEIRAASLQLLRVLFPDPWPKANHRHRRLVQASFAELAVARLAPGGVLELATDRDDYAVQMRNVLGDQRSLRGGLGGRGERALSFYEQRAMSEQRTVYNLRYVKDACEETSL